MTDVVKGRCVYHEEFDFGRVILVRANVEAVVMFDRMNPELHDANTVDSILKEPRENRRNRCWFFTFSEAEELVLNWEDRYG